MFDYFSTYIYLIVMKCQILYELRKYSQITAMYTYAVWTVPVLCAIFVVVYKKDLNVFDNLTPVTLTVNVLNESEKHLCPYTETRGLLQLAQLEPTAQLCFASQESVKVAAGGKKFFK